MTKEYDLVILGGGVGGYVAAIRASQLNMNVALVEKDQLGGTCLHKGCIPSKAFLKSAEVFQQMKAANDFGIDIDEQAVQLDFTTVQNRKNKIVGQLYQGVQQLMEKHQIDIYHGFGRILGPSIFSPLPGAISIEYDDDRDHTILTPKNVLIATGSHPKQFQQIDSDHPLIMNSEDALEMKSLPDSMVIIGGGVIGIEWASMLADFGVEVSVIESAAEILPGFDVTIAREARKSLEQKGIRFLLKTEIVPESISTENDGVKVDVTDDRGNHTQSADQMLIAIGRQANHANIGIENTEIKLENDYLQVNEFYQTDESHIYAIGDVIGGLQLAHVASHEGIVAVEHMADEDPYPLVYKNIPQCVYASPEIASVGYTEEQLKDLEVEFSVGTFPFRANGKALIEGTTDGLIKLISDENTEDILGIHMIGPKVTDMISEGGLAKLLAATPWEITQNIYPHPSLSEVMGEAAMAIEGRQIHG